ncbi:MAG: UDP-N-acetylmuramoyl-L-alanine--D-glutamate ligase, partial [Bacillota bacterium]|uniref:UDP-N-acetylmuramoylalanine--D-glutamate ligase n=1 Tax=Thermanaerosceptrum fracticalcis TaxID=1712410 RepID=A0A7G6DZJ7_THEFR|nr:UDP-N-acetylmuramoyl-L-alanine--D-glutamate ligase [Thermanaerosceptrum fracticalcis]QNB45251.1 UDP-N-acetylmuramoyl-L-alanine--D-glutamate ligase [Thermanaerosceptrum fracticalcis]
MEVKGKVVVVIGAGKSGMAAAQFLASHGSRVYLNDIKTRENLEERSLHNLEKMGITLLLGAHGDIAGLQPDLVIVSPGVPLTIPPVAEARERNIPVWSEMELASRFTKAPMVVVTGTNGKTTTTALIGQIMEDAGFKTFVGGNIGVPFISEAEQLQPQDVAILEASSFQLETTESFKPFISLILNITPDHIDWHGSLEGYIKAKAKIFARQDEKDWLILNGDDRETRALAGLAKAKVLFFSRKHILEEGICVENGYLVVKLEGKTVPVIKPEEIFIKGSHNLENALAAVGAGWLMGVSAESLERSLRTFPGVPHRLEPVLNIDGVRYINDSKGTNPDASIKALEAYPDPIILIAGGKSKGSDFTSFAEMIKDRVKALVLVGQAAGEIEEAVKKTGYYNYYRVETFKDAVYKARDLANQGDIVLLSPACASFDMFRSYEHRGEVFKELVHELAKND